MLDRSRKVRLRRANQLARRVVDVATGSFEEEKQEKSADSGKNPAAVELGRLGGKRGGPARAKKLTPEQRSEISRKAAFARWKNKNDS